MARSKRRCATSLQDVSKMNSAKSLIRFLLANDRLRDDTLATIEARSDDEMLIWS